MFPLAAFEGMEAARREGKRFVEAAHTSVASLQSHDVSSIEAKYSAVTLPYAPLPTEGDILAIAEQQERVVRPEEKGEAAVQQRIATALLDWANKSARSCNKGNRFHQFTASYNRSELAR